MSVLHIIVDKNGNDKQVRLTPIKAIVLFCEMCFGHETDPAECTSPKCPLAPFRTGDAHSGKVVTDKMREQGKRLGAQHKKQAKSLSEGVKGIAARGQNLPASQFSLDF